MPEFSGLEPDAMRDSQLAALAQRFGIPGEAVAAAWQLAQSRRVGFLDAALALGILSLEQARALMASLAGSSGGRPGSSGEFDATFRWSQSGEA